MSADGQFFGQIAGAENFDFVAAAIGEAGGAEGGFVHAGAVVEGVEALDIDGDIGGAMADVVEAALGDAPDEGHLAAFETDADGAAGTGGLAFATATAGLAVTAGFALAEAFAAMFGAGPWFKIV